MGEARAGDAAAIESRLFVFQDELRGSLNPQLSLGGCLAGKGSCFWWNR
jgi:hypothetical protein